VSMEEEPIENNGRFRYQIAMSNRIFSDNVPESDLPCMNCLRVEMGERACYSGICDACGETPPSLRWKFPELQQRTRSRQTRGRLRSGSVDRERLGQQNSARRRLSNPHTGLSASRVDQSSFTHTYNKIVGVDSEGCDKDSARCVICLAEFQSGEKVRRLGCMHLFHVTCADHWFNRNRDCPVCRVDIETSAAQYR